MTQAPTTIDSRHTNSSLTEIRESCSAESSLAGKHVLIVEDEGITQMQLRIALRKAGLILGESAMNGEQGVAIALRDRPEIVLMDVNMPGPFNGLEAARRILGVYRTCIVLLTAYPDLQREAEAVGAAGYIVKPVDSGTLCSAVRRAYQKFLDSRDK